MKKKIFIILLFLTILPLIAGDTIAFKETSAQKKKRMEWWRKARFGMFIHWGLYSLAARHEWVKRNEKMSDKEYEKYFKHFNPDLYNPSEWAKLAREAGMKYVVITTKHHEGFCLWDSKYTDYKVTNTPYGKDLIRPFVEAFKKEGLKVGFYYSLLDWHHPDYVPDRNHPMFENKEFMKKAKHRDMGKYVKYMMNQLTELLTNYGEISTLFLDYSFPPRDGKPGKGRNDWQSIKIINLVRKLQPNIIVDDRLDLLDFPAGWDYRTPEQFLPRRWLTYKGKKVPWETCQTFSGSWGYYRDEYTWKSVRQLIIMLVDTVSKGGNLLLNVGPTGRGTFDYRTVERLRGIGEWMRYHSRSIYGCTEAPPEFKKPDNCILTYNPETKRLYVHVLVWPSVGRLFLDGFAGKVAYAQLLNDASEVQIVKKPYWTVVERRYSKNTLVLKLPIRKSPVEVPVIELFLK